MTEPLLSLRGVTKRFPGVLANDRVDFDAFGAEVHALLGENGAGKSTLMKVAYGYYPMDEGEIWLKGARVRCNSPADARSLGIGMVFQNFTLIPAFSVAENIALYLSGLSAIPDMGAIEREIKGQGERYGLVVDPRAIAGMLAAGQQQKVEILKLLMAGARVLIFDEPTSVLPPQEIERLFEVFTRLKEAGFAIVFITHKLREVLGCADRITVMRRGAVAGTMAGRDATEDRLLQMMFGSGGVEAHAIHAVVAGGDQPPLLRLDAASSGHTAPHVQDLSLEVRPGEIVGVAGVSGNGQRELGDLVLGLLPCTSGRKWLFGTDATTWSVARVRQAGVAFVPENPIYMLVAPGLTLAENFAVASPRRYEKAHGLGIDWDQVDKDMRSAYRDLELEPPEPSIRAGTLSGGNLQRFSLARELGRAPRLVVAVYPTRGLDARTTAHAQKLLLGARAKGAGVLLISQDLGEIFELSDRIVVLRAGRVAGAAQPAQTTPLEVGRLMTGDG